MAEQATFIRGRVKPQDLPTNPIIDVCMILFLEDIAEKQGVDGLCAYMLSQGAALAETMSAEDYATWEDFIAAINEGRSIFSALEGLEHFAGYAMVTPVSPFHEAIITYIRLMGEILEAHDKVVDYYNGTVMNAAVESMNIIHQAFRRELVKRITVAGKPVRYAEMAVKGYNGNIKLPPDGWIDVLLEKAEITMTHLSMAIRQNNSVLLVYPPGGGEKAEAAAASAPKVLRLKEEVKFEEETPAARTEAEE